jgi:hypothetical protein
MKQRTSGVQNQLNFERILKKNQVYDFDVENIEEGRSHEIVDK